MSQKAEFTSAAHERGGLRIAIAALLVALVTLYSVGVISGRIDASSRIDAVHLALILLTALVAVALVHPQMLDRLKRVKLSTLELELLEQVHERQVEQGIQLNDIRMILPLLLPDGERTHLLNLDSGNTRAYRGSHALRAELRRLRSMRLLQMKEGRHVADLKDGSSFDLADFAELTKSGKHWLTRVREIELASTE